MRSRRSHVLWSAAAAVGALALTGCGALPPGAASEVNGHTITRTEVADLATAQCDAADRASKQGQSQPTPVSRVQALSLALLIDTELTEQYARTIDLTPDASLVTGFYSQFKSGIDPLPQPTRGVLTDVFQKLAQSRALLVQAGSESTGKAVSNDNLQELLEAGLKARSAWSKSADITTDARYGPDEDGYPGAGGGSVSEPVSSFAKQAAKSQPSAAFVSELPAGQKCG